MCLATGNQQLRITIVGRGFLQAGTQLATPAVDTGTHGTHLHAEGIGNLVIAHADHVAEHHGDSEVGAEFIQGTLEDGVEVRNAIGLLWGELITGDAFIVLGQGFHADAGAVAHHIEKEVGGDAVQPAFEGTRAIVLQGAEYSHEGFLGEVFSIMGVTGEAVGQTVNTVGMFCDEFTPAGHGAGAGVEGGGSLQLLVRLGFGCYLVGCCLIDDVLRSINVLGTRRDRGAGLACCHGCYCAGLCFGTPYENLDISWQSHPSTPVSLDALRLRAVNPALSSYIESIANEDESLHSARQDAEEFGLTVPDIMTGQLLTALTAMTRNSRSTGAVAVTPAASVVGLYILKGLDSTGILTCVDPEAEHQRQARQTFRDAGYSPSRYRFLPSRPLEVMGRLAEASYQLIYVDASPMDMCAMVTTAWPLLTEGGVLIMADALLDGTLADESRKDRLTVSAREADALINSLEGAVVSRLPLGAGMTLVTKTTP